MAYSFVLGEQCVASEWLPRQAPVPNKCSALRTRVQVLIARVGSRQRQAAADCAQNGRLGGQHPDLCRGPWEAEHDRVIDDEYLAALPGRLITRRSNDQRWVPAVDVSQR